MILSICLKGAEVLSYLLDQDFAYNDIPDLVRMLL